VSDGVWVVSDFDAVQYLFVTLPDNSKAVMFREGKREDNVWIVSDYENCRYSFLELPDGSELAVFGTDRDAVSAELGRLRRKHWSDDD
jgi:hypothetical protein